MKRAVNIECLGYTKHKHNFAFFMAALGYLDVWFTTRFFVNKKPLSIGYRKLPASSLL
jgi:hypothetical protein